MKNRLLIYVCIISAVLPLMAVKCYKEIPDNEHSTLRFYNNSDSDVYIMNLCRTIGDTAFMQIPAAKCFYNDIKVSAREYNDDVLCLDWYRSYEQELRPKTVGRHYYSGSYLDLYVFDASRVDAAATQTDSHWREGATSDMVLERQMLSLEHLTANEFTVSYPEGFSEHHD